MSAASILKLPSAKPAHGAKMPIFTSASGMSLLWEKASEKMTSQELEWFANGAAEQVANDARDLAGVLESTGYLVSGDDGKTGSLQDAESVSNLLANLQNQIVAIAAMAEISADANQLVRTALKGGST